MIGWVFFRATDIGQAMHFLLTMFGFVRADVTYYGLATYLTLRNLTFLLIGGALALSPLEQFSMRLDRQPALRGIAATLIFVYATAILSVYSFNAFIYFRF